MEDYEKILRGGRNEKRGVVFNDNEELEFNGWSFVLFILVEDSEIRIKDEVIFVVL